MAHLGELDAQIVATALRTALGSSRPTSGMVAISGI
jgi:hypothetical protein